MQNERTLRYIFIDNISGILILDMVFIVHVCPNCNLQNNITEIIQQLFCYFMAWFFFKSGMFYNPQLIPLTNGIKKLITPYILFTLAGLIIHIVFSYIANEESLYRILLNCKESLVYRGGGRMESCLMVSCFTFFYKKNNNFHSK